MQTKETVAIIVIAVAALIGIIAVAFYGDSTGEDDSGDAAKAAEPGSSAGSNSSAQAVAADGANVKDFETQMNARMGDLEDSVSAVNTASKTKAVNVVRDPVAAESVPDVPTYRVEVSGSGLVQSVGGPQDTRPVVPSLRATATPFWPANGSSTVRPKLLTKREDIQLKNGTRVRFVMEKVDSDWKLFFERLVDLFGYDGLQAPLEFRELLAASNATDQAALRMLNSMVDNIDDAGAATAGAPGIWGDRQYVVYVTDQPLDAGPFRHLPAAGLLPGSGSLMRDFLGWYRDIKMVVLTTDVATTGQGNSFYFQREPLHMPTYLLEGRLKDYNSLSMRMHMYSFSARAARDVFAGTKDWAFVTRQGGQVIDLMGGDALVGEGIPLEIRGDARRVSSAINGGPDDGVAVVDMSFLARRV